MMVICTMKGVDGADMIGARHTFVSYFAFAVDTIMKVLLREGIVRGPQELVVRTGQRVRRLERRFNALLARWRAGTLAAVGRRDGGTPHPNPPPQGGRENNGDAGIARPRAGWGFPRGRAWVVRVLAPLTGQQCVGALCVAWEEPEMAEFYAAAPQLGRILRPLAHMIGAPLPAWLQLPKRVRVRRNYPSPRPSPTRGEGEDTSARPSPQSGEGEGSTPTPAHRVKPSGKPLLPRSAGLGR